RPTPTLLPYTTLFRSAEERELAVADLLREPNDLACHGETLVDVVRAPVRPVAAREREEPRRRVADVLGHGHGLHRERADRPASLVRVRPVEGDGEPPEEERPQRRR